MVGVKWSGAEGFRDGEERGEGGGVKWWGRGCGAAASAKGEGWGVVGGDGGSGTARGGPCMVGGWRMVGQ